MRDLSVIVPVYNAEGSLPELFRRLRAALAPFGNSEVIFVDDGSRDGSWHVIRDIAMADETVRAIRLMRNFGQQNATLAGIRAADGDVIVTLDDDLQHPPEEIPRLVTKLAEGYDVVYGTPAQQQHGVVRGSASVLTKLILRSAMGVDIARYVGPFRAFRGSLRDAFARHDDPFVSIDVLLTWGTDRFAAVPVAHAKRARGRSGYSLAKLTLHALNLLTGFTALPLRVASIVGFLLTIVGAVLLLYVLGRFVVEGVSVPGFAFLASIICIFSGAQLFALGVIGEYLARMHFRLMQRPPYVISDDVMGPVAT